MKALQRFDVDRNGTHKEIAPVAATTKGDTSKMITKIIPFEKLKVKRERRKRYELRQHI